MKEWLYYYKKNDCFLLVEEEPYMVYVLSYETEEESYHNGDIYTDIHYRYAYKNEDGELVPFEGQHIPYNAILKEDPDKSFFGWVTRGPYSNSCDHLNPDHIEYYRPIDESILDETTIYRLKNGEMVNIFNSNKTNESKNIGQKNDNKCCKYSTASQFITI